MFSKTLIKLIDYAIFPAVMIVAAKIIGIIFLAKYFQASYVVDGLRASFENYENYIAINSYSSYFMLTAVLGGLVWVVVKAHVFHDTHVTPALSAKLFNSNLDSLIHDTETIFSQSFIWLSYSWLLTIMFGVQSYYSLSYWSVFWVSLAASVLATVLLVMDIEREITSDAKELEKKGDSVKVVTMEQLKKEILS